VIDRVRAALVLALLGLAAVDCNAQTLDVGSDKLPACSTSRQCIDGMNGDPARCDRTTRTCAPLLAPACDRVLSARPDAIGNDETTFIGLVAPRSGPHALEGQSMVDAANMVLGEIAAGLVDAPARIGSPARPLGIVVCDEPAEPGATEAVAAHLLDEVKAPVIIGRRMTEGMLAPLRTKEAVALGIGCGPARPSDSTSVLWQACPYALAIPEAMASAVTNLDGWLRTPAGGREPLGRDQPLKVMVVTDGSVPVSPAASPGVPFALARALEDATVGERARELLSLPSSEGWPRDIRTASYTAGTLDGVVTAILGFQPHVVILAGEAEAVQWILDPVEKSWPGGPRPRWWFGLSGEPDGVRAALSGAASDTLELRPRVGAFSSGTSSLLSTFSVQYRSTAPLTVAAAATRDNVYLSGVALAAQSQAPTRSSLASTLDRLSPGRGGAAMPLDLPSLAALVTTLAAGGAADVAGASGPLDFDLTTHDDRSAVSFHCVGKGPGVAATYAANSAAFQGSVLCED
jgi:hypothetical protein